MFQLYKQEIERMLDNKCPFRVKVNPRLSRQVQKFAFSKGVYWYDEPRFVVKCHNLEWVYFDYDYDTKKYSIFGFSPVCCSWITLDLVEVKMPSVSECVEKNFNLIQNS